MSGLDEQGPNLPRCHRCGMSPKYWGFDLIWEDGNSVHGWIFSNEYYNYLEARGKIGCYDNKHVALRFNKSVTRSDRKYPIWSLIHTVDCSDCWSRTSDSIVFTVGLEVKRMIGVEQGFGVER